MRQSLEDIILFLKVVNFLCYFLKDIFEICFNISIKISQNVNILEGGLSINDNKYILNSTFSKNEEDLWLTKLNINNNDIEVGANINIAYSNMITIQVWDVNLIKPIEKAIIESNLGINPQTDCQLIRLLHIPHQTLPYSHHFRLFQHTGNFLLK